MATIVFWGPVVGAAAIAALFGVVADRVRRRRQELLLRDGDARRVAEARLRYFSEVGDSSNM